MVPYSVIASLGIGAALSAAWPVAIYLVCRRRIALAARNVWVGAGVFFLFAMVLEGLLNVYVLEGNHTSAAFLHTHSQWFALYGCCAAALFEETGRYVAMRFWARDTGTPGTPLAYAIGHGGLESIVIGTISLVNLLVYAVMFNAGTLDATFAAVPPEALAKVHGIVAHLSVGAAAMATFERLAALLIQIGLSLFVWRAVERRQLRWLGLALLAHAAIDFAAGLTQSGQLSAVQEEAGLLVISIGLVAIFLNGMPRKARAPQPA
jgi:uncharacterized membrane protein YhfC